MDKKYIIYCHTNKINGKKYIGQTNTTPARRWGKNGSEYISKGNEHFKNAILKYGWDNFEHDILFFDLNKEQANQKEKELIKQYKTKNPKYGYNKTSGGSNANTLTDAQKEKLIEKNNILWNNGFFKNIINTPVYCVELDIIFESALDAERKTGIDNSSIQKACKEQLNYSGFLPNGQPIHWVYFKDLSEEKIKKLKNRTEIIKGTSIPIECLETGEIFNSSAEAEKHYNLPTGATRKCATGLQKSAGKHPQNNLPLHWKSRPELIKNKNKLSEEKVQEIIKNV